jgi:hypothetical protein
MRIRTMLVSRAFPAMLIGATVLSCSAAAVATTAIDPTRIGDLTLPVASMTGAQLFLNADTLRWKDGRNQDRDCVQGKCKADIDAVEGQEPPEAELIHDNGTIVARFQNKGSPFFGFNQGAEKKYGFSKRTNTEYYLIAIKDTSVPEGWSWIVRSASADDISTTPIASGRWTKCKRNDGHNANHPPVGTKSEFYRCGTAANPNGNGTATLLYTRDAPGWLDCDQGCCSAGQ